MEGQGRALNSSRKGSERSGGRGGECANEREVELVSRGMRHEIKAPAARPQLSERTAGEMCDGRGRRGWRGDVFGGWDLLVLSGCLLFVCVNVVGDRGDGRRRSGTVALTPAMFWTAVSWPGRRLTVAVLPRTCGDTRRVNNADHWSPISWLRRLTSPTHIGLNA